MSTPAPRKAGRPLTLPEGNNPMAKFMRDYHAKYGKMLPIATIAAKMGTTTRTIMRWRDGESTMGGTALVALAALRKECGLE